MLKSVFIFFLLSPSVHAQAFENLSPLVSYQENLFESAYQLNENFLAGCRNCSVAGENQKELACQVRYKNVFGKEKVSIHFAFGYLDFSEVRHTEYGGVTVDYHDSVDLFAHEGLVNELLKPCRHQEGACGFSQDRSDPNLLTKLDTGFGHRVRVELHLSHGSATPYYSLNIGAQKELQARQTAYADANFFDSLGRSDFTIYAGHARGGGGPDFSPPILMRNGQVNYNGYYRKMRPGFNHLISALNGTSSPPSLMAILGCASDSLFKSGVLKDAPRMGFVSLKEITDADEAYQQAFLVLDGFLRKECGPTLARTINLSGHGDRDAVLSNFP